MLKISHLNTFYFLKYAHVRYVKSLFTHIPKQQNMLKISLLFKKFTNFMGKELENSQDLKNAKFSGYCFYMNTNTKGDFHIYISVPLSYNLRFKYFTFVFLFYLDLKICARELVQHMRQGIGVAYSDFVLLKIQNTKLTFGIKNTRYK